MYGSFGLWVFGLQIILVTLVPSEQTIVESVGSNINDTCTLPDGAECIIPNSICNDDDPSAPTCQCDVDYVASDSLDFCHATYIGQECSNENQCNAVADGFTYCNIATGDTVGTCDCYPKYESNDANDTCLAQEVNLPCIDDIQCKSNLGATSFCQTPGPNGRCKCLEGSVESGYLDKCLVSATHVGEECEEHIQCNDLGDVSVVECLPNVIPELGSNCLCKSTQAFPNGDNTKCLANPKFIGDPCDSTEQCKTVADGFTYCNKVGGNTVGTCDCNPKYESNEFKDICLAQEVLLPCIDDIQCEEILGVTSYCETIGPISRCNCEQGSVASGSFDRCLVYATHVGDPCEEHFQCDYLGDDTVVECNNDDPSEDLTCRCKPDVALPSADNDKCLLSQFYGGECVESIQCFTGNTTCRMDLEVNIYKCLCIENLIFDGNQCIPSGLESAVCTVSSECADIPGSDCLSSVDDPMKKCRCIENFVPTSDPAKDKCLPLALIIGEACEEAVQCQQLGGTECKSLDGWSDSTCECRANLHPDPTNTRCLEDIPE